jgi:hypothetical protein
MVSSIAMAITDGFEPNEKPRQVDRIVADSQQPVSRPGKPLAKRAGGARPIRASVAPQSPRGLPNDDLEERLGDQLHFSIDELAKLSDRSAATIFRYLRLGLLSCIRVGDYRRFTRTVVLDFLRRGTFDLLRRTA